MPWTTSDPSNGNIQMMQYAALPDLVIGLRPKPGALDRLKFPDGSSVKYASMDILYGITREDSPAASVISDVDEYESESDFEIMTLSTDEKRRKSYTERFEVGREEEDEEEEDEFEFVPAQKEVSHSDTGVKKLDIIKPYVFHWERGGAQSGKNDEVVLFTPASRHLRFDCQHDEVYNAETEKQNTEYQQYFEMMHAITAEKPDSSRRFVLPMAERPVPDGKGPAHAVLLAVDYDAKTRSYTPVIVDSLARTGVLGSMMNGLAKMYKGKRHDTCHHLLSQMLEYHLSDKKHGIQCHPLKRIDTQFQNRITEGNCGSHTFRAMVEVLNNPAISLRQIGEKIIKMGVSRFLTDSFKRTIEFAINDSSMTYDHRLERMKNLEHESTISTEKLDDGWEEVSIERQPVAYVTTTRGSENVVQSQDADKDLSAQSISPGKFK